MSWASSRWIRSFGARAPNWEKLRALFMELRGIALEAFPSYPALDLLHHIGNACCRHDDGRSAAELWRRCPALWPANAAETTTDQFLNCAQPSVGMMDVPLTQLRTFVRAVIMFWDDTEYIYNESISQKHPSLISKLEIDRAKRGWLPRA
jgi:hypothetical protein